DNSEDRIRPGMSFRTELFFEGVAYTAVDPLAIQWSSDGPYLWKNAGEVSERVPVQIIQRNANYVLVAGDVAAGDEVIIEGLQSLRPGAAIRITRRMAAPVSEGTWAAPPKAAPAASPPCSCGGRSWRSSSTC